jgi:hypothetical protein
MKSNMTGLSHGMELLRRSALGPRRVDFVEEVEWNRRSLDFLRDDKGNDGSPISNLLVAERIAANYICLRLSETADPSASLGFPVENCLIDKVLAPLFAESRIRGRCREQ